MAKLKCRFCKKVTKAHGSTRYCPNCGHKGLVQIQIATPTPRNESADVAPVIPTREMLLALVRNQKQSDDWSTMEVREDGNELIVSARETGVRVAFAFDDEGVLLGMYTW